MAMLAFKPSISALGEAFSHCRCQILPSRSTHQFRAEVSASTSGSPRSPNSFPRLPRKSISPLAATTLVAADDPAAPLLPKNVVRVTSLSEYEAQFANATDSNQLLVVEFSKESLPNSDLTYQTLVDLHNTTPDVVFLQLFADQCPEVREIFVKNNVKQVPSYVFFRHGERVHEDTWMNAEKLKEQVLYYGQAEYPVVQLESPQELQSLLESHGGTERLIVVQVTLNFCGPCVRVYPAVLQMSHKMTGSVVFARLFGDLNDSTKGFLSELGIVEAPTFLFYRDNQLLGRYVGSGKGELIGEVLRYQGVECT